MTPSQTHIGKTLAALLGIPDARRVTHLVSPTCTVVAVFRNRPYRRRGHLRHLELVLTIGTPNAANRQRIKLYQRAGVRFPVTKLHIQYYAKRRGHC